MIKKIQKQFWNIKKKRETKVILKKIKFLYYCFPKFHENSLQIDCNITKNPQKFQCENLQAFYLN